MPAKNKRKGKKGGNQKNSKKRSTSTAPKKQSNEQRLHQQAIAEFDDPQNPYLQCVRKKIRNHNKKLAKITALEERQKTAELNQDQLSSLANKSKLLGEVSKWEQIFEELKSVAYDEHLAKKSATSEDKKASLEEKELPQTNDAAQPVQEETPKNETSDQKTYSASQKSEPATLPQSVDHLPVDSALIAEEVITSLLKILHVKNLWQSNHQPSIDNMLRELEHQQVQLSQQQLTAIGNLALAFEGCTFNSQQPPAKTLRGSVELAMKYVNKLEHEDLLYSGLRFSQIHEIVERICQTTVFHQIVRG